MRQATFATLAESGRARIEGNPQVLAQLMGTLGEYDAFFEIMPGTKPATSSP
jgi:alkyl sulfatase BDS1-like metallo-beta-lactamase superfamily hydrolase